MCMLLIDDLKIGKGPPIVRIQPTMFITSQLRPLQKTARTNVEEVDATLNNLDDEIDDTEHALTGWSGSYSPGSTGRAFSSATGTGREVTPARHPSSLSQRSCHARYSASRRS